MGLHVGHTLLISRKVTPFWQRSCTSERVLFGAWYPCALHGPLKVPEIILATGEEVPRHIYIGTVVQPYSRTNHPHTHPLTENVASFIYYVWQISLHIKSAILLKKRRAFASPFWIYGYMAIYPLQLPLLPILAVEAFLPFGLALRA